MVVIGGLGTPCRARLAALFWSTSPPSSFATSEDYQLIVFALLVIIFARFFREGLWGFFRPPDPPPCRARSKSPDRHDATWYLVPNFAWS
jgi:ABC-type branched-subunit amino acid transport system permease subunit